MDKPVDEERLIANIRRILEVEERHEEGGREPGE
jgi:hypothetical protein